LATVPDIKMALPISERQMLISGPGRV
jgi:hypothetical protein